MSILFYFLEGNKSQCDVHDYTTTTTAKTATITTITTTIGTFTTTTGTTITTTDNYYH